ncbi:MAG: flotillin family protein [Pararhodobacter sp.]|nr:flotillin family protein [Pararhodobacter sp.]
MLWFLGIVVLVIVVLFGLWLLQRFYAKASRESALVRTGLGGQRVVLDGGCLALPILHQVQRVTMATLSLRASRAGAEALLTGDRLRADVEMAFELRVVPTRDGVATAAQALGNRIARGGEAVEELFTAPIIAAMQNAAASRTLDQIHLDRASFAAEVAAEVSAHADKLGLTLIGTALVSVDQADFTRLNENNAFNAEGMRKLAQLVAEQRKERVRIEVEADLVVRETQLAQTQRRLDIARAEREAEIAQREHLRRLEAEAESTSRIQAATAERASEEARIAKEQEIKAAQVASDEALRRREMAAIQGLEEAKLTQEAALARKRAETAEARAAEEAARAQVLLAAESVQLQKERVSTEREREIALLRQKRDAELLAARAEAETGDQRTRARAEAEALQARAEAERARMLAEAEGRAALIAAENGLDPAVIAMRLEERRLDRLPEIMTQMMKPVEKIDSIRINHIGGMGGNGGGGGLGATGGSDGAFGTAMEQILGMAVRLPAMKQMGAEIGLEFDANLAGRTADYANRIKGKPGDQTGQKPAAGTAASSGDNDPAERDRLDDDK